MENIEIDHLKKIVIISIIFIKGSVTEMRKIYLMVIGCLVMFGLIGCDIKSDATNQVSMESSLQKKVDVETKSKVLSQKNNTKKFEKVDTTLLNQEEVMKVEAEASFSTACETAEEIYENSSYIVKGKVNNTYFTVLEGLPYTVVDLQITESLKGDLERDSINTILLYGGYMTIQQEVFYYDDASKFKNVSKEKWKSTFLEKRLTDAEYPAVGEEYVMCLIDNELSEGTYVPVNEYETVFKKVGDSYTRTLPSDNYFGTEKKGTGTCFEGETSFHYNWFKGKCNSFKGKGRKR